MLTFDLQFSYLICKASKNGFQLSTHDYVNALKKNITLWKNCSNSSTPDYETKIAGLLSKLSKTSKSLEHNEIEDTWIRGNDNNFLPFYVNCIKTLAREFQIRFDSETPSIDSFCWTYDDINEDYYKKSIILPHDIEHIANELIELGIANDYIDYR